MWYLFNLTWGLFDIRSSTASLGSTLWTWGGGRVDEAGSWTVHVGVHYTVIQSYIQHNYYNYNIPVWCDNLVHAWNSECEDRAGVQDSSKYNVPKMVYIDRCWELLHLGRNVKNNITVIDLQPSAINKSVSLKYKWNFYITLSQLMLVQQEHLIHRTPTMCVEQALDSTPPPSTPTQPVATFTR